MPQQLFTSHFPPSSFIPHPFPQYNSLNDSPTINLSKLSCVNPRADNRWLGWDCRAVLLFPALCLGTLGIFRVWYHGADWHCVARCIFCTSPFSYGASCRVRCGWACMPPLSRGFNWVASLPFMSFSDLQAVWSPSNILSACVKKQIELPQ